MNVHCLLGLGFMLGTFDAPAFRARNLVGDDTGERIDSVGRHLVDEDVQNGAEINALWLAGFESGKLQQTRNQRGAAPPKTWKR